MNKVLRFTSTIGALIMASGCGGSVAPIETSTTQVAVMPTDLGEYASSIGCVEYEPNTNSVPHVLEWGICRFEETTVMTYLFATQLEQDSFFDLLMGSGGVREETITKGLVVFAPENATKLGPLSIALGM